MTNLFIFFNKYYKHLIFIFVIIFAFFVSFLYFDNLKKNKIKKDGQTYINFLLSNSDGQSQINNQSYEELKSIENDENNFGILSKLSIVQNFIAKSDFNLAKTKLRDIFSNKNSQKIFKDYAILLYSKILISEKKFDELIKFAEKYEILENQDDFSFKLNIIELLIIAYFNQNKIDKAIDLVEKIKISEGENQKTVSERIKQLEIFVKYNQNK